MDHIIHMFSKYDNVLLSDEGIWYAAHLKKETYGKHYERNLSVMHLK